MSQQMWDSPLYLRSKQLSYFVQNDFDKLPKEGSKQLIETASELKSSIDPESTV